MRITINQTGSNEDVGRQCCCICRGRFHLGPASCFAYSDDECILWGEVCPRCIAGGPDEIQRHLDRNARWALCIAEEKSRAAEEGISDCPALDEVLAAEAFYERPMFETAEEYDRALSAGEVSYP